ncbi:MAG: tetratricopeptide repeat protein [Caldilineaceae bacterium]|nr:tetratricopeptide repeat protein [Caldilineaceae bacterium]
MNRPFRHIANLPKQLTPFIDRGAERAAVSNLLADPACRLLTITGPGGIGKTRLAIEAATDHPQPDEHVQAWAPLDGVFFVKIQPSHRLDSLITAIADAVACPTSGQESPQTRILQFLSNKALLLVLDSFDELMADATDAGEEGIAFLSSLLHESPHSKLLVTSREALNLQEEWLYPLSGLTYPTGLPAPDELAGYSAIQLFAQCARRIRPDFSLTTECAGVVRICQLVEGFPLALELAASWTKTLNCSTIANEIERNIDFLATSLRNMPERHRSMVAIFNQTWQMLSDTERQTFKRLAVFRGGFHRLAAESVVGATLPLLSSLVNKSLLRWEPDGRYQLHGLLRQYAEEQLNQTPHEAEEALNAHACYFAAFLDQRVDDISGGRQRAVLQEIGVDLENIRHAWSYAVAQRRIDLLAQATYTFFQYCDMQGRYQEAAEALDRAISLCESLEQTPATQGVESMLLIMQGWNSIRLGRLDEAQRVFSRSQAIEAALDRPLPSGFGTDPAMGLALLAVVRGDYATASALAEASRQQHEARNDLLNLQTAHYILASVDVAQGRYGEARSHAQAGYRLTRLTGNEWMMAYMLALLGEVSRGLGEYEEARQYYQQCYFVREAFHDPEGMAVALSHLARIACLQNDYAEAEQRYHRSLAIYQRVNDRGGLAGTLQGLGDTALRQGDFAQAREHLYAALQIAMEMGWRPLCLAVLVSVAHLFDATDHAELAQPLLALASTHPMSSHVTRDAAAALRAHGASEPVMNSNRAAAAPIALDDMLEQTLATLAGLPLPSRGASPRQRPTMVDQPLIEPLTNRELEVLQLIAEGLSNQQIADELVLSVGTVKFYTGQIYGKLGVNNRTRAVAHARSLNLIDDPAAA